MSLSSRIATFLSRLRTPPVTEAVTGPSVGRKEVRKRLIEAMQPILMEHGFGRFDGGVARRYRDDWVDVVEIFFIKTYETTLHSPSIQLGRYFTFAPPAPVVRPVKHCDGRLCPRAPQGHVQKLVYRRNPSSGGIPNIWSIDRAGTNLGTCLDEIVKQTREEILPWFDWLDDLEVVLELIRRRKQDVEGHSRDPLLRGTWGYVNPFGVQVLAGLIAAKLSRWDECAELLRPVLERGGLLGLKRKLIPLSPEDLSMIRQSCERCAF